MAGAGVVDLPGAGAGVFAGAGFDMFSRIDPVPPLPAGARFIESANDVSMKTMAHQVVALERNVAAPRGQNAV